MSLSKIKAIIFDVDGVLLTTHAVDGTYLWSRTAKEDLGLSKIHFQKIFSSEWDEVVRGRRDTIVHLESVFSEPIFQDLNLTPQKFIQYWLAHDNKINHDMIEFVQKLQLPHYFATNQEAYRGQHIVDLIGKVFHGQFITHKIGYLKSEPEFFAHVEASLGLQPSDLLLIDDTRQNTKVAAARGWTVYFHAGDVAVLQKFLSNLVK